MRVHDLRVGPRTVAYILAMLYGLGAMAWPPVPGARPGAAVAVVALTIVYTVGLVRTHDRRRY